MIYTATIKTTEKGSKNELKKTRINVTKGLVYKVEFYFPSGSAGLVGVAVFDGLYQVWPSTVGEFFKGEDQVIAFDDMYLKETAPYELQAYTYNEDDTFPHEVQVRIGLVSKEVFLARFMPTKSQELFIQLLDWMSVEREEQAKQQRLRLPGTPFEWMVLPGGGT